MPDPLLPQPDLPGAAVLTAADLALLAAAARQDQPLTLLRAVDTVGRNGMGHQLCTAMRFDAGAQTVRRLYTSMPEAYPAGGTKRKRDTAWAGQVLRDRRVFVAEGEAAIRQHFDDHAVILELGLRSIVNVPIVWRGACLGTVNFLWPGGTVLPAWIALAELLGLIATPDWLPDWSVASAG